MWLFTDYLNDLQGLCFRFLTNDLMLFPPDWDTKSKVIIDISIPSIKDKQPPETYNCFEPTKKITTNKNNFKKIEKIFWNM